MEDGREVITIEDIKRELMKEYIKLLLFTPFPFILIYLTFLLYKKTFIFELPWNILMICTVIVGVAMIVNIIIAIIKLQKGTLFTITTDVLVNKQDYMRDLRRRTNVDRLYFQYDFCDFSPAHRNTYVEAYRMELGAVFCTAFIGDSFTLIKVRKRVYFAYNHKLYDVQIPA